MNAPRKHAAWWVVALAAVFAVLQLANVTGRDTPDTRNYVSYALSLTGASKREAATATIDYVCAGDASLARRRQSVDVVHFHAPDPTREVTDKCRRGLWAKLAAKQLDGPQVTGHTAPFASERFRRIFEVRPGYPALLAPFVAVFGVTWGVWLCGVLVAAAGGVLVFLILRTLRASTGVALTGQALYYVLPVGTTAMRPMTEGLMLALTLSALWGCALALRDQGGEQEQGLDRVRLGAQLVAVSLVLLFAVKHSQALFLGVCLAGACAVVGVRRWRRGRRPGRAVVLLGAIGVGAAVGTLLVARALHYPSQAESLQDLLTNHFERPDRTRPWREFLHLEFDFWVEWGRRQCMEPLFVAALGAGAWGVLRRRPAFGVFAVAGACTGILTQAAHPDINIWGARLIVLAWLLPVLGLPLLLEEAVRAWGRVAVPGQQNREGAAHSLR